jgi:hypothetical protein
LRRNAQECTRCMGPEPKNYIARSSVVEW